MTSPTRILAAAGAIALASYASAGAATVHLVTLGASTVGASTSCAAVDKPAAITELSAPVLPGIAAGQNVTGITTLRIDLDSAGRLTHEHVLNSSGNRWIDKAARESARMSNYGSEIRNCEHVAGAYALIVDFTPQSL